MDDYNYVSIDIKKEFAALVEREYDNGLTIADIVKWLYEKGYISKKAARDSLIREFYYTQLKTQNATESRLDCAVVFDVTDKTIQDIVYNPQ